MSAFRLRSSIGKKLVNGATGVLLLLFIVAHLAGNLTIFVGQDALNTYAHFTHSLGWVLIAVELGLGAVFVIHAASAISVWLDRGRARSTHNSQVAGKGGPTHMTLASRSMLVTGIVLLVFLVVHLYQFRFGPNYLTSLHGEQVWDLWRVVVDRFRDPIWVAVYVAVMILLGFHLRHGFWSAFQSLGALSPASRAFAFSAGVVFALVIALGFVALPIYVYLFVPSAQMHAGLAMGQP